MRRIKTISDQRNNPDPDFFDRADAVIKLASTQLEDAKTGEVNASTLYAAARFDAWRTALGFTEDADMAARREETLNYFLGQYRKMLMENFDDYIDNFEEYMRR